MKKARQRHFEKEPEFWTILKGEPNDIDWQKYMTNERMIILRQRVLDELLGRQTP